MNIREIIRQLQMGEPIRAIHRRMGVSRNTVKKYRCFMIENGLQESSLPDNAVLEARLNEWEHSKSSPASKTDPYRDTVCSMHQDGLSSQVIYQRLTEEHQFTGSYSSVLRFVRKELSDTRPEAFIRVEVAPGSQAQVDFGYAGRIYDRRAKRMRKAWVFVMLLSHSRHLFACFVFDQKIETWLEMHRQAFEFFGGIPHELVIDNLKAGITKAVFHDPQLQESYRGCAEHYGFLISPCRPATPRHKGKVECGGVKYVKNNFLPRRSFLDIAEANEKVLTWCLETAGRRIHGTTRQVPLEVFDKAERAALLPLPTHPYQVTTFREAKLHSDCHITFDNAYYSAPFRLIGRKLWVAATIDQVQVFYQNELVATHTRAQRKGERKTDLKHLPPQKASYYLYTPAYCRRKAHEIGPGTEELVARLLEERPLNRLRAVQGILKMAGKYGPGRLEAACTRALAFDELSYRTIRRILDNDLDREKIPGRLHFPREEGKKPVFSRHWSDFFPDSAPEPEKSVSGEKNGAATARSSK